LKRHIQPSECAFFHDKRPFEGFLIGIGVFTTLLHTILAKINVIGFSHFSNPVFKGIIMKKFFKLTVLAAATVACAAQAEGLYTYALVDGGVASTRVTGSASKTEFVTGGYAPNFVGMTYEKPTQGGLTVGVKMEQGFTINAARNNVSNSTTNTHFAFGNGDFLNREANIYVKSNEIGKFVVGTQPNLPFTTVLLGDPRHGSNYGSALATISGKGGLTTVDDAAIGYTSNSFNGLTLAGQIVPESRTSAYANTNGFSYTVKSGTRVAATYAKDALTFGVAGYDDTNFTSTSTSATVKTSGTIASLVYKMGAATLKGIYASQKNPMPFSNNVTSVKTTGVGGNYALTGSTVVDAGYYTATGDAGYKLNTLGLGIQHALTKELKLYVQAAKVDNKGSSGSEGYNFTWSTVQTGVVGVGGTANTLNAGLLLALF
jgi:predicted porin